MAQTLLARSAVRSTSAVMRLTVSLGRRSSVPLKGLAQPPLPCTGPPVHGGGLGVLQKVLERSRAMACSQQPQHAAGLVSRPRTPSTYRLLGLGLGLGLALA